jgi:hypothetical protein
MRAHKTNADHARRVAKLLANSQTPDGDPLSGVWSWIDGVANGLDKDLSDSLDGGLKAILAGYQAMLAGFRAMLTAFRRALSWSDYQVWKLVRGWVFRSEQRIYGRISRIRRYLTGLIFTTTQYVLVKCMRAVAAERIARRHAVGDAEGRARREVKALHGTVEREAASAYRMTNDARASLIGKLLDFAAEREPLIRDLTKVVADGVLDILEVDDPVLRIVIGFAVKEIIDRLGIDKAVGVLVSDLVTPILGDRRPTDLHAVILDITSRLGAVESQWATFFQDGGSQVEQAGEGWRDITSIVGDAAILAFTAQAVADPKGWSGEISDTIGTVVNDLAVKAVGLFGG